MVTLGLAAGRMLAIYLGKPLAPPSRRARRGLGGAGLSAMVEAALKFEGFSGAKGDLQAQSLADKVALTC